MDTNDYRAQRGRIGLCEMQIRSLAQSLVDTNGLLRGESCIVFCKTGVERRGHAVQRSEKQIVWSPPDCVCLHDVSVTLYHALLDEDIRVDHPNGTKTSMEACGS